MINEHVKLEGATLKIMPRQTRFYMCGGHEMHQIVRPIRTAMASTRLTSGRFTARTLSFWLVETDTRSLLESYHTSNTPYFDINTHHTGEICKRQYSGHCQSTAQGRCNKATVPHPLRRGCYTLYVVHTSGRRTTCPKMDKRTAGAHPRSSCPTAPPKRIVALS